MGYQKTGTIKALWYCTKRDRGCRASIYTIEDAVVKCMNEHSH